MKTFLLLPCVFALATVVAAQSTSEQRSLRYGRPFRTATLDLATGTVTRGPAVSQRSATTVSDFPNIDLGGFVGVETGGGDCEWFEAGTKGFNGNTNDLMKNFVVPYCSAALAVESGGPGGMTTIGLYEGYVAGGGTPTTAVAVLTLSGLPANTAHSSPFSGGGGAGCFLINVQFGTLVPFADGPIGYSWLFRDFEAAGVLAATVPFLANLDSNSTALGLDGLIDRYSPPGSLLSQFGGYVTTMQMDIHEVSDCTASVASYNSTSPPNEDALSATNAVIGTTWSAEVTHAAGTAAFSTLLVRGAKIPGNGAGAGQYGRLLVSGAFLTNLPGMPDTIAPIQVDQRNFGTFLPLQFGLACSDWFCQALTGGGGATRLSNGIAGTTGTQ